MSTPAADTKALADRMVELCKQGENRQAVVECYADDVVSVEAMSSPEETMPRQTKGKEAVLGKTDWWYENHEHHSGSVEGPFMHGDDRFALIFDFDVTVKASGQRMQMKEVAVYTARDGKVAHEEFYYTMG